MVLGKLLLFSEDIRHGWQCALNADGMIEAVITSLATKMRWDKHEDKNWLSKHSKAEKYKE